ncbi:hypothetical protein RRG08_051991 [Elysia crispata]|uniref:Uncharacterized protein n=1 Tax=Elysia crispata TaxID=231223 RepID=A0AAE1DDU6_9GAST|nr:hypothetical protein RRG08_051991 [Elysia crispata]
MGKCPKLDGRLGKTLASVEHFPRIFYRCFAKVEHLHRIFYRCFAIVEHLHRILHRASYSRLYRKHEVPVGSLGRHNGRAGRSALWSFVRMLYTRGIPVRNGASPQER